jgi:hypothetical protein
MPFFYLNIVKTLPQIFGCGDIIFLVKKIQPQIVEGRPEVFTHNPVGKAARERGPVQFNRLLVLGTVGIGIGQIDAGFMVGRI